ncbi:MAG: hypothetical protein U5R30_20855 [Deltaproteobacteria bacterium]|nr:hypothetical protein [Deltaproteobacteria bacterium]
MKAAPFKRGSAIAALLAFWIAFGAIGDVQAVCHETHSKASGGTAGNAGFTRSVDVALFRSCALPAHPLHCGDNARCPFEAAQDCCRKPCGRQRDQAATGAQPAFRHKPLPTAMLASRSVASGAATTVFEKNVPPLLRTVPVFLLNQAFLR